MCFYFNKNTSKEIATEDIVVYKECNLRTRTFSKKLYVCGSVYNHYIYSLNNWSPLKVLKVSKESYPIITNGLHSNIYRNRYDNTVWIIPKGSVYFKNSTQYVSNRLVFKEFITEQYMDGEHVVIDYVFPIVNDVVIYTNEEKLKVQDLLGLSLMHFRKFNFFSNLYSIFRYIIK